MTIARLLERFVEHLQQSAQRLDAHRAAAGWAEMLDAMFGGLAAAGEREMDQPFLAAVAGWAGETGDSERDVGLGAVERLLGHRAGHRFRYRVVMLEQLGVDPEQV